MAILAADAHAPGPAVPSDPYFEKIVAVVLATFTVFTGFTINKAIVSVGEHIKLPDVSDGSFLRPLGRLAVAVVSTTEFWALVALLALLLRYLMGSAIHLNDTYVKRLGDPPQPPLSTSKLLLFKDLGFLVIFGIVVLMIAKPLTPSALPSVPSALLPVLPVPAPPPAAFDFAAFVFGCELFLLCGFVWSVVDMCWRFLLGRRHSEHEWPGIKAYVYWMPFDITQGLITYAVAQWSASDLLRMGLLAVLYCGYLIADISSLLASLRIRKP